VRRIAGVDEAGRGALAGPVVAAACILPDSFVLEGLTDSKKLTSTRREELFEKLQNVSFGIGIVSAEIIDEINILQATFRAMKMALEGVVADEALIDGNLVPPNLEIPAKAIVKGDLIEPCISAASILAKVTRDRLMCEMEPLGYGFEKHMGYGTQLHREKIKELGPIDKIHRKSFIRELISQLEFDFTT